MAMRFRDRQDAGRQLAEALKDKYKGKEGVVYPLPRGGIPLGLEVARVLEMPLGLIIPRKIGHPFNPEYAICAVSEGGETVCNERELAKVDKKWFEQRVEEERQESKRRRERYLPGRDPLDLEGKTAILVDDGIATGLTMRAAIRDARERKAAQVVVAIPVVPQDTAEQLKLEVDDVVALSIDAYYLGAVGAYYDSFNQFTDDEVIAMMARLDETGMPLDAGQG
jgi:predicted phosphoribosyltransferase